ncbi:MAG: hypothetical protein K9W46_05705 [Candidatus Heimdallarchaeum endolithica]|uniref:Zinc ribbon domain-containing protein n=1 Tax=Candidatus Heimdallarchaeum endolithica TaxID=2876572 RepID=A0A9Y1BT00_9ARCH|nr:MAG: hypothetical protein K9W46_05705 [Candidatus Heimdallarchaeum endolithica]
MNKNIKKITCPQCSAPLEIEDTQTVFTCPYCQFTSKIEEKKEKFEHYMLPVKYNILDIRKELIGDLMKNPGVPDNLHNKLKIVEYELKFIPYWIISVHNHTEYTGEGEYATYYDRFKSGWRKIRFHLKPEQGVFDDEREFTIYAAKEIDKDLLNFQISTRGKRYFQRQEIEEEQAVIEPSIINVEQAKLQGITLIREIHKGLILKEIARINQVVDNPEVTSVFLLHIPFYFIKFKVGRRYYQAKMEANTGRTVVTQIPKKITYTLQVVFLGVFFILVALLSIILLLSKISPVGLFLLMTSSMFSIRTFQVGLRRRYKEKED